MKRKRSLLALLAGAAASALVLGACGNPAASSGGSSLTSASKPVSGGTLVYLEDREEACLDPQIGGDIPQAMIAAQYTDNLVYEGAGEDLALARQVLDNLTERRVYTFTLRDNVRFTDGTPLNAAAVQANIERVVNPKTGSSTDGGYIAPFYEGSKVLSPYVLQVTLKTADSSFLDVMAQSYIGIESPKGLARGISANCEDPIGSGPFEIQSYVPNQEVVLIRNPHYNSPPPGSPHSGPAYLKKIIWKIVPDASVRWAALQDGQANVIYYPPSEDWASAAASHITIFTHERPGSPNSIIINASRQPFTSLDVRQAFLYASNEKASLKSSYFGTYPYVGSPLVPGTPDYDGAFQNAYGYDPAKAKQLLEEAGWTGHNAQGYRTNKLGQVLSASIPYDSDPGYTPSEDLTLYEDIQAAEKKVGFDVTLDPLSSTAFDDLFSNGNYQTLAGGYWITNTPDVLRTLFSTQALKYYGTNDSHSSDPQLDTLLAEGLAAQNPKTRQKLYDAAQAIVSKEAWILNLYPAEERLAIASNTHGVSADYAVGLPDFYSTWIS